jgi:hypothetical protein
VALPGAVTFATLLGGGALCLLVLALHPADPSDLPLIAAAVPVGFVVAFVTFISPAGLGSRDLTIAAVLATVLPTGVAVAAAAGFRSPAAGGRARVGGRGRRRRSPEQNAPALAGRRLSLGVSGLLRQPGATIAELARVSAPAGQ